MARRAAKYAYHATPASNLPGIARIGLIPNDGTRGIWPDDLAVEGLLFFCDSLEGAQFYREQLSCDGPAIVLRFPIPPGSRADPAGDMMGERHVDLGVPSTAIEIEIDGRWSPLDECPLSNST